MEREPQPTFDPIGEQLAEYMVELDERYNHQEITYTELVELYARRAMELYQEEHGKYQN